MADVTASMVKELRERTGAGMMDCKNALVETAGDMAKAVEAIQKKGLAKAVKAAGRVAADGAVGSAISPDRTHGVLVEVNCQTDFVARGDGFQGFVKTVAAQALANAKLGSGDAALAALEAMTVDGKTLREIADAHTAASGEKHAIRRVERYDAGANSVVATYIHHGARLGVLVEVASTQGNADAAKEFAEEIALQVASMSPRFVKRADVAATVVDKQREIVAAQLKTEGEEAQAAFDDFKKRVAEEGGEVSDKVTAHLKDLEKKALAHQNRPEAGKQRILDGKLEKWFNEVVLDEQPSVKDSKKTIAQITKETPGGLEIRRFARFELGEGIDRGPVKDFAQEVAEMTGGAA